MFEVYEVPNDALDGTEEFIEVFESKSDAIQFTEKVYSNFSCSLWVVLCSETNGYEKVVAT